MPEQTLQKRRRDKKDRAPPLRLAFPPSPAASPHFHIYNRCIARALVRLVAATVTSTRANPIFSTRASLVAGSSDRTFHFSIVIVRSLAPRRPLSLVSCLTSAAFVHPFSLAHPPSVPNTPLRKTCRQPTHQPRRSDRFWQRQRKGDRRHFGHFGPERHRTRFNGSLSRKEVREGTPVAPRQRI